MTTGFNTGSTFFGPVNTANRNYLVTATSLPGGDWSWVTQFKAGNGRGSVFNLLFADATMTGTGALGNNYYLGFGRAEHSTVADRNILAAQVKHSSTDICSPAAQLLGTQVMVPGNVYYGVLQRRNTAGSDFIELYTIAAGQTVTTYDVQKVSNPTLAATTLNLAATGGSFGTNMTGYCGWFAQFNQSFSFSELTSIAAGVDPDTIVTSSGNRKSFIQFNNAGSTLTNAYGANNATANGTWTNQPSCGSLVAPPVATNYILLTERVCGTVYPANKIMGTPVTPTIRGTYSGTSYTPPGMEFRILNAQTLAVVQTWTALTSFSASAGAWSGVASIPESTSTNPVYILAIRDSTTTSITYQSGQWFGVAATALGIGQSQQNNMDSQNAGIVTLSGTLYGWYSNPPTLIQPYMETRLTADAGSGSASAANQFYSDSGGKPYARFNVAVVGTSIKDWAGYYVSTMTSSTTGYIDNELVNIMVNGVNKGTANVVVPVNPNIPGSGTFGTTLTVKNAQFSCVDGVKTTQSATWIGTTMSIVVTTNANIFVGAAVTGTGIDVGTIVTAYDGATALTISKNTVSGSGATLSFYITTLTGQSSGVSTGVSVKDANAAFSETFVPMQNIITQLGLSNCFLRFYWLQGSADSGGYWGDVADVFMARFDAYMTSIGATYEFILNPQCRVTDGTTGTASIRLQEYFWAINHAFYGTKILLGIQSHDMTMNNESVYSGSLIQSGSNDTTHVHLGADNDCDASSTNRPQSITGLAGSGITGANAGVTRASSAYVVATQLATVTAFPEAFKAGDFVTYYGTGPHENRYGAATYGTREGRHVAWDAGLTATPAVGPTLARCLIPPGGDGSVIYVILAYPKQGLSFGTPLGVAANTYGFEVSADGFNTLKTISTIEWISSNVVKLTLSSAVTGIVTLNVVATTTATSTTLTLNSGANANIVANMGIIGRGVANLSKVLSYAGSTTLVLSASAIYGIGPVAMQITNLAVRYLPSSPVPTPDGPRRLGDVLYTNSGFNGSGDMVWPTFPAIAVQYDYSPGAIG